MPTELHTTEAKKIVASDLNRDPSALLTDIVAEGKDHESRSGDVVIMNMIAKFSTLLVVLGRELDNAQRTVARLTWAIFFLTVVLLILTAAQVYFAYVGTKSDSVPSPALSGQRLQPATVTPSK